MNGKRRCFYLGKDKYSIFMANLAALLALESYTPEQVNADIEIKEDCIEIEVDESQSEIQSIKVDKPDISGPVKNLPWQTDDKFLKAQKENNTPILIAAYCAVLIDPLPGEEYNVNLAANSLIGKVVDSGQIFSQNKSIGPYTKERAYREGASYAGVNIVQTEGGGVCKIATSLYNVAILSNLDIVERHNHSMPVNYVPYGQDATVAYGAKDFKFKNNTKDPILIWSRVVGNRLYIGFYGQNKPPQIKWNHKVINKLEAPEYTKLNPELKDGEERVIIKGIDGATVESTIEIKYESGKVETKDLGISHYNPMPRIIEVNQ